MHESKTYHDRGGMNGTDDLLSSEDESAIQGHVLSLTKTALLIVLFLVFIEGELSGIRFKAKAVV